jgi:pimeloyl-ACP methyl ester carboxylesterase
MSKPDFTQANLPAGAIYKGAPVKKYVETVVFVHHFGGSTLSSKRHQEYFNDIGYDCVAFDMPYHDLERTPLNRKTVEDFFRGIRHAWADKVEQVLRSIDGPIILYSFSMIGGAALEAMARTRGKNVHAWIGEGGPFMQVNSCYWNYMNRFHPKAWTPVKIAAVGASFLAMGIYDYQSDVKGYFKLIPKDLPILSIRAWQDQLVPIAAIDEFFEQGHSLNLEILSLPEADHLQGLKEYPNDYKPRVEKFLARVSKAL